MAAFSWMLCEGILLFILIRLVFYMGFLKSKIFFLLLGWGKLSFKLHITDKVLFQYTGLPIPIVIVAIVSYEHYGIDDTM